MQKRDFLYRVAEDLWRRYGDGIEEVTLLLPNNRSRIFFVDALSQIAGRPIWGPNYTSIDALMCELSGMQRLERIRSITELYKIYSRWHQESFDSFYHWGEVLLNDFDAVDKYLIDAEMLFSNLSDLKDMDGDISYLTAEQVEVIRRFWATFEQERPDAEYKKKFLTIWNTLGPIYKDFTACLEQIGAAYSGLIYRRAAEKLRSGDAQLPEGKYAIVGFNALSQSEKQLFDHLKNAHEALFYWDFDDYYLLDEKQEAGLFVRENLSRYPMPPLFSCDSAFKEPKKITVVATASDSLQCKYATEFIEDVVASTGLADKRTAIVLTDEHLLSPLLYSLPDSHPQVGGIEYNVTMGYPLRATLAYSFAERLIQLQQRARENSRGVKSFYHSDVEGLLVHPFVVADAEGESLRLRAEIIKEGRIYIPTERFASSSLLLRSIFCICSQWDAFCDYLTEVLQAVGSLEVEGESKDRRAMRHESFGLIIESVVKTTNSLKECDVEIKFATYTSLLRRVLQSVSIPYTGEPLGGVQVMGILETRNLDFDNVLLLSMNDDNFPSARMNDLSFIPHNLRFAYGVPTPHHSEGVYAYYFYRLLQRARRVDMVYCSVSDDSSSGEQSRYIYQLDFESGHTLTRVNKLLDLNLADKGDIVIEKRGEVERRLREYLNGGGKVLSPSAFNNYMECSLKFYFKTIAGLRPEEEIDESVDTSLFGTLFHKAMEILYTPLLKVPNPQPKIAALINSPDVHRAIVQAITEEYFGGEDVPEEDYSGSLMVIVGTIEKYINSCLLRFDAMRSDNFRLWALEEPMKCDFTFSNDYVTFGGISDRLDMVDGVLRVIDYKTGSPHKDFAGVEALMGTDPKGHAGAALQTLLYSMMAERLQQQGELEGRGATPSLYYVRYLNDADYLSLLYDKALKQNVECYGTYAKEFERLLAERLQELFDTSRPFEPTTNATACSYCDFKKLCRRG